MITNYNDFCIICGRPRTDMHHCFKGNKHRNLADADELLLPLCHEHHLGNMSVHKNKEMLVMSQIIGQLAYERDKCAEGYGVDAARESFLIRYGKNYL